VVFRITIACWIKLWTCL